MAFVVVGINHRTAPIEVRERFAFSGTEVPDALGRVLECECVLEAALVSTCNRTEFYLHVSEHDEAIEHVRRLLAAHADQDPRETERYLDIRCDLDAVQHLYRVASGLDSMVLGEVQIQGQVRSAYEIARGLSGGRQAVRAVFNRLFQSALSVGGRVRSETRVSEGAASVPSAAVELARKIFGSLRSRRGLVLGAGDMGELTLECLVHEGVSSVLVASRNLSRAQRVAEKMGVESLPFSGFWERLGGTDILITSTAAPHPMITLDEFRRRMPSGLRSPLLIVDISIPRDVEPRIGDERNVFLYSIDDLQHIVTANFERRKAEVPRAEEIIEEEVAGFWRWYCGLQAVPLIKELRGQAEEMRRQELERALSQLDHLSAADRERIDQLTRQILQKLLHRPTARLRAAAQDGRGHDLLAAARYLFDVADEDGYGNASD